jgi:hypothetical protein
LRESVAHTAAAEVVTAKTTAEQHLAIARQPGRVMAKRANKWSVQALEIAEVSVAKHAHTAMLVHCGHLCTAVLAADSCTQY